MEYASEIKNRICDFQPRELIFIGRLWQDEFSNIPETAFFKTIERLSKAQTIIRVAKGVYCVPKETKFGAIKTSESEVVEHYVGQNGMNGVEIGYSFYNSKNLSTQISKKRIFFISNLSTDIKTIDNVVFRKIGISLNEKRKKIIQSLSFLESYNTIQDLNIPATRKYLREVASEYDESEVDFILKNLKFKKSTIAFYMEVLNYHKVRNNLIRHLSKLSKYNIPKLEEIYEVTQR